MFFGLGFSNPVSKSDLKQLFSVKRQPKCKQVQEIILSTIFRYDRVTNLCIHSNYVSQTACTKFQVDLDNDLHVTCYFENCIFLQFLCYISSLETHNGMIFVTYITCYSPDRFKKKNFDMSHSLVATTPLPKIKFCVIAWLKLI